MSHLLHVTRLHSLALQRQGTLPLMVEFTVVDDTAPYLVSSSSSVLWVDEAHPGPVVKAAVREVSLGAFFREVVEAVAAMGRQQEWGNVHPLTTQGLRDAIEHVAYYDLGPLELLIPRSHPVCEEEVEEGEGEGAIEVPVGAPKAPTCISPASLMPKDLRPVLSEFTLPFRVSAWVPQGVVVVVPKDRTFVGMVSQVTPKKLAAVVHNAARGIAIAGKV